MKRWLGGVLAWLLAACGPLQTTPPVVPTDFVLPTATATATITPRPATRTPNPSAIAGAVPTVAASGETAQTIPIKFAEQFALVNATHAGAGEFAVRAGDKVLMQASGPYAGTVLWINVGQRLEVQAEGAWTVQVWPLEYMRVEAAPGAFAGAEDEVVLLDGRAQKLKLNVPNAGTIVIGVYGDGKVTDLLKAEGPYDGDVALPAEAQLLEIRVRGEWRIETK